MIAGLLTCLATLATAQTPRMDTSKLPPYLPGVGDGDYLVAPPYTDADELTARDGVPKGTVQRFVMDSHDSKLYPGIAKTAPGQVVPYHRRVSVYIPSQYVPGTATPFLISQDSMTSGIMPTILDNMIADHRLPAMVAIFIDSGGGDSFGSERGLEYDTMSGKYAEFVETEVLPRISRDYKVTFTKDPNARMTMGGSSGGACAFTMAWYHPDLYHRVLTYSGTYVDQMSPPKEATPHGAWEYHEHLIPQTPRKPIRIWMQVGDHDLRPNDPPETLHNWPMANERMAAALKKKEYHYQFVFSKEAGHVDGRVVNQTLPQALEWVWQGYRAKR
ncbi:alpha/beta hydrolase [Fimbriimonas ginsengisoli]|uniref:Putative esterase n=1 Tax=Fimbriimonas ginsengisoli Gsoil 348 TaxID=661478 RepID=A0A068NUQ5_FIMGI|nr:alpha/beta hydrolase-fold protein [Fimbriimonas ginsengisoli]AIE87057.1 putative esterase [Fimbriimonas ginsengisoli Gsoil 348]